MNIGDYVWHNVNGSRRLLTIPDVATNNNPMPCTDCGNKTCRVWFLWEVDKKREANGYVVRVSQCKLEREPMSW